MSDTVIIILLLGFVAVVIVLSVAHHLTQGETGGDGFVLQDAGWVETDAQFISELPTHHRDKLSALIERRFQKLKVKRCWVRSNRGNEELCFLCSSWKTRNPMEGVPIYFASGLKPIHGHLVVASSRNAFYQRLSGKVEPYSGLQIPESYVADLDRLSVATANTLLQGYNIASLGYYRREDDYLLLSSLWGGKKYVEEFWGVVEISVKNAQSH